MCHPSGETALPCYQTKIVVRVLAFIKNYQAQVWGVVIFITLLTGFVPLLQVMFFVLLEDYLSGLTHCERSGQYSIGSPAWSLSKHNLHSELLLLLFQEPYMRFSPHTAPRSILSKGSFSSFESLRPSSTPSRRLTKTNWVTFSCSNWILSIYDMIKGEDCSFTKHMQIKSRLIIRRNISRL
jgi:hypothetical protein